MFKHLLLIVSVFGALLMFQIPALSQSRYIRASDHLRKSSIQMSPPFFKNKTIKKVSPIGSARNFKPKPLNKPQEQLLLWSSPNSVSEIQYFGVTDTELAVNYDWYDYNILRAFQMHSLNPLRSGFMAVQVLKGQGQYVNANYSLDQIKTVEALMNDFSYALASARTARQKADTIVRYVADKLQYSNTTSITDEQTGDLVAQGLYIGNLQNNIVSEPQTDYGGALEAYITGGGICQEYSELTQLGFLYAGLQAVVVDNVTPALITEANTTRDTSYLHAWNEVELDDGQWYGADSTWTNTGTQGVYDTTWEIFTQSQSLTNDYYINFPNLGLTNYPLHTATANAQILRN